MTTLNECQQAMLKAEKRERQMGVVLQVLGVATMLTAIGVIFARCSSSQCECTQIAGKIDQHMCL